MFLTLDSLYSASEKYWWSFFDNFFVWIYFLEILSKMIANGIIRGERAYFKTKWNFFDFFVVIASILNFFFSNLNLNLNLLKTIRVLRPLMTITKIDRLKHIITTVGNSLPYFTEIVLVLLFFLTLMAIMGVQLFRGVLGSRCIQTATQIVGNFCTDSCAEGWTCQKFENPNMGLSCFDNFFSSFLIVNFILKKALQGITLEGWSEIFMYLNSSYSSISFFYFFVVIVIGNIFLLNLSLAVILTKYKENYKPEGIEFYYIRLSLVNKLDSDFYQKIMLLNNLGKSEKDEFARSSRIKFGRNFGSGSRSYGSRMNDYFLIAGNSSSNRVVPIDGSKVFGDEHILEEKPKHSSSKLFLNPPSYRNFDGNFSNRQNCKVENESFGKLEKNSNLPVFLCKFFLLLS